MAVFHFLFAAFFKGSQCLSFLSLSPCVCALCARIYIRKIELGDITLGNKKYHGYEMGRMALPLNEVKNCCQLSVVPIDGESVAAAAANDAFHPKEDVDRLPMMMIQGEVMLSFIYLPSHSHTQS